MNRVIEGLKEKLLDEKEWLEDLEKRREVTKKKLEIYDKKIENNKTYIIDIQDAIKKLKSKK